MADDRKMVEGKYLTYQGKPLVREENTIVYGDLNNDPCVLVLEIMSYTGEGEDKTPDTVMIQILDSKDPNKIIKQGRKQGMHAAFEMGLIWLDIELKKNAQ